MSTYHILTFAGAVILCVAYTVLIGSFTLGWFRLPRQRSGGRPSTTFVTIIVAARNEIANLGHCLGAIAAQDYPPQFFEVIVVDDHSVDGTGEMVRKIISDHPLRKLTLFTCGAGQKGKKDAIMQAMPYARGAWIVTTDADCTMDKQWLTTLMQCTEDAGVQMLLAPVVFRREKSVFGQMQELEFMSLIASSAGAAALGLPIMCNGANLAYRKSAFEEVNGYTTDRHIASGDDMFLMMKMRKRFGSHAIRYVKSPAAIVVTQAAATPAEFVSQRLRWVSKSKHYRDTGVLMVSVVVYAFSLSTLIVLAAWAAGLTGPLLPLAFLSVKLLVDFPLMAAYSRFASRNRPLLWYVPLQFIYLIYVVLIGALGNVLVYRWKGRKLY